jgi:MFS family permease
MSLLPFHLNAKNRRTILYVVGFLFGTQISLGSYFIASYIARIIGETHTGFVYGTTSLCTLFLMLSFSKILKKIGNRITSLFLIGTSACSYAILALSPASIFVLPAIILYQVANMVLWLCLDIYLEHYERASTVSKDRALYLTLINLGWLLAPALAGLLLGKSGEFSHVFAVQASIALCIFSILYVCFKNFTDSIYKPVQMIDILPAIRSNKKALIFIQIHAGLQIFYASMVMYMGIYLMQTAKIPLSSLGVLFSIMLIPFTLFGIPVEKILSNSENKNRIFIYGFFLLLVGSITPLVYRGASLILWGSILFISRVGAVILETGTEALFFKAVNEEEAAVVATFRMMHPLSYLIVSLIGGILLSFGSISYIFIGTSICLGGYIVWLFVTTKNT